MDVRCEKCQTEYELDEARLKPGGVTVKCTNCGHMFKIRKRSNTNVGAPVPDASAGPRRPASKPPGPAPGSRADSVIGDETVVRPSDGAIDERQWLIRLENGEQKSCRELSTLQQWIVAGVVTRESLISRTGKTWKRLGDIAELTQYFTIADEARSKRQDRSTKPSGNPAIKNVPGTLLGIGASAAGGTILPDDDDDDARRSTGNFKARPATTPPPLPAGAKTPPLGSNATEAAPAPRRPLTTPPPPPAKKQSQSGPLPTPPAPQIPPSNRSTGAWAADAIMPTEKGEADGPAGPLGGRVRTTSAEPGFAGRVRVMPTDESSFRSGKMAAIDDDDDMLPERRGGRGGLLLAILALLVMGGAAGVVYVFVIKKDRTQQVQTPPIADAAVVAVSADAAIVVTPVIDAPAPPAMSPLDLARAELAPDLELKLRDALKSLDGNQEPGVEALRAHLSSAIAQALTDRASVTADKAEADKMRKDAKTIVLEAATAAQRAFKAAPNDAAANLAMADVLRLQNKPAKDIKRYLDAAKANPTAGGWKREIALAEALVLARDGKLDDAKTAFAAIDAGEDKLETSGDVRARFQLGRIAYAQNKPTDAKPLIDQVLAAQPEHAAARALAARIETTVAKSDPLPPEDPPKDAGTGPGSAKPPGTGGTGAEPGDSYDRLLAKANALAEKNCTKAMELFAKALEQKPNGVEALTGMGYCHIDAKQFASAFSKFRAALAVSSRYEPALWGVGEAYQQQGRKDQAIEAFKAYLEVYPNTAKAQKALDRLGAGAGTPPDPGPGSATPPPDPTPTPTPTPPTPTPPEGAGSGSG